MTDQFSAQDPALGYLYQIKYALWLLLEAGREDQGIEIAIENLDDIEIIKDGNKLKLIQTKHHRNPDFLTNASPDLWKTISAAFLKGGNKRAGADGVAFWAVVPRSTAWRAD